MPLPIDEDEQTVHVDPGRTVSRAYANMAARMIRLPGVRGSKARMANQ